MDGPTHPVSTVIVLIALSAPQGLVTVKVIAKVPLIV
jgi:hypothetical protein